MSSMNQSQERAFWKTKNMAKMSREEWESLCDGCGKCCCIRLEDEDTRAIYVTDVSCKLFDSGTCQCMSYANRQTYVPDCVQLSPKNIGSLNWLPMTCAYRLIYEGKDLPEWHHLISGSRDTIHQWGLSVQDAVINESLVSENELLSHIVIWPGEPDLE